MLLAIDTSTAVAGVALYHGAGVRAEHAWHSGQSHTTQLLPHIQGLLAEDNARPADLTGIGVALGPGSFNGLRVGLATAKLLSFTLGIPLVGVDTLEATAYQYVGAARLIRPLYDAGRGQVATALYEAVDGELRVLEEPRLAELADVLGRAPAPTLVCGELKEAWIQEAGRRLGPAGAFVEGAAALRRPGYLAELAWRRLAAGRAADPATLQPLYLRRPPVLEKKPGGEPAQPAAGQGARGSV